MTAENNSWRWLPSFHERRAWLDFHKRAKMPVDRSARAIVTANARYVGYNDNETKDRWSWWWRKLRMRRDVSGAGIQSTKRERNHHASHTSRHTIKVMSYIGEALRAEHNTHNVKMWKRPADWSQQVTHTASNNCRWLMVQLLFDDRRSHSSLSAWNVEYWMETDIRTIFWWWMRKHNESVDILFFSWDPIHDDIPLVCGSSQNLRCERRRRLLIINNK